VAPVLQRGGNRQVYLPAGLWYDLNTGDSIRGPVVLRLASSLDSIPAYVRAGSILPLAPVITPNGAAVPGALEVRVYPGANGEFWLYEDDGTTWGYLHGRRSRIPMRWNDRFRTLVIDKRWGSYPGMPLTRTLRLLLPNGASRDVVYNGKKLRISL
jgi:alpha-D-xyloside xylohydrolase